MFHTVETEYCQTLYETIVTQILKLHKDSKKKKPLKNLTHDSPLSPLEPQDLPRTAPLHTGPGLWAQSVRGSSGALRACLRTGKPCLSSITFLASKRE